MTLVFLVYGVAAVISNLIGGWLVDHRSTVAVAAMSIGGFGVAFAVLAALASGHGHVPLALLCVVVAAWSLVGWWFNPAQNARPLGLAGAQGPIALSLSGSAIYAGQAVGGAIGAVALGGGAAVLAASAAACAAAAVAVLLLTARPRARRMEPAAA